MPYVPDVFKYGFTPEVTILNYLARMEDLHAAFPKMAPNAASPYKMVPLCMPAVYGEDPPAIPPGPPKPPKKPCQRCNGSGWLMGRGGQYYKCPACNGTGEG